MGYKMKKINIPALLKNNTVKNSGWILGEKIYQMTVNLILTIFTSRYLGPSNFGILNYGATLVSIFLVFTKLGLDEMISNEFIKHRDKEGDILGTALVMRLTSATISIIVMAILVFILQADSILIVVTSMIQSFALIFQAFNIFDYWFQSYLKSKYVSIAKAIAYSVMAGYKFWLLATGKDVVWFAVSSIIDCFLIAIFLYIFYKRNHGQKLHFNLNIGKKLFQQSHHFIISGIMVLIYTQIDKIMIGQMLNEFELGLYSAALAICTLCNFIPEAILVSARQTVFNAKQNKKQYIRKLKQTYAIIFWICIAMASLVSIFSPIAINVVYGEQYLNAIPTLCLLVWYVPFSQLGVARGIWIVSENKNKYSKYYTFWGVIVNICLNSIMIPLWGILGATVATIITELFTLFITPLFYKETRIHTKYVIEAIAFNFKEK